MPSKLQLQIARQRLAARVISEYLLDMVRHNGLPVLSWTIGDTGVTIVGTSYEHPSSKRRDYITAWAKTLNIELREHANSAAITITGVAEQIQTGFGNATIVLTCDVYHDEGQAADGDQAERHYIITDHEID
jgi:hypothetical protein